MKLLALMKKEFHRFFHDPRLIIAMLLPGILIFVLYSILGETINSDPQTYDYRVYVSGEAQEISLIDTVIREGGNKIEWLALSDEQSAREEIEAGEATAILIFSDGFDDPAVHGTVRLVYDAMDGGGSSFAGIAGAVLREVGMRFDIVEEGMTTEDEIGMEVMQAILPFIIVCFIFSACMSVTLESVAGEKERGTLSTILVTSAKRSHIALGKILPLACISMLGALSSFLGVALSMPKLMGVSMGFFGGYSFWSYLLIFFLIMSIVPLVVSLISTVSTLARSVKEASAYTSFIMIFVMIISLVSSFLPAMGNWVVAVPVLNAVVSMQGLLAGGLPVWQSLVSIGANLLYSAALVFVMTKLLSSEKVMFGK